MNFNRASSAKLALTAALAALSLNAGEANAGTYVVETCDNGSLAGWTAIAGGAGATANQNCGAASGGFNAGLATAPGSFAGWQFDAPVDTELAGFSLQRAFALPQNQAYGTGVFTVASTGTGPAWSSAYVNSSTAYYSGIGSVVGTGLTGQTGLQVRIDCGGGGACSGNGAFGLGFSAAHLTLRDSHDPVITSASGTLLANGPLQGTRSISYGATDRGGGVYRAILKVDGVATTTKIVDANGGACASPFAAVVPCKPSVSDTIALDTTALTEGTHSVQLFVRDATDSNEAYYGPFSVVVDNIPAPINTSAPLISGLARHGQSLVADTGAWTGIGITLTRQWQRYDAGTWQNIAGATAASYAIAPADYGKSLRVRTRAVNSEGTTDAYSDPTAAIASPTDPNGDFDGDGIPNSADPDADGDLVPNDGDANPFDPRVGAPPGENTPSGREVGIGTGGGASTTPRVETINGQGGTANAALSAAFEATASRTMTVRWGQKRRILGTLLQRNGQPIVGAKLDVSGTPATVNAATTSLGQVATDIHGRFSYALPAGISRTIRFGYKAINEAATYAQTTEVSIRVIPRIAIKVNKASVRNRQAVTFSGRIAGAPAGSRKVVEIQALDGRRWRTFTSTRLGKGGTFKYSYRFMRTTFRATYQFRAIVRAEKGWPFNTGTSNTLKVKVRP